MKTAVIPSKKTFQTINIDSVKPNADINGVYCLARQCTTSIQAAVKSVGVRSVLMNADTYTVDRVSLK